MFHRILPAALLSVFCVQASAEDLHVPGLSPDKSAPKLKLPECNVNVGHKDNCARTLACIGQDGLWFDGQARGWNGGTVMGQRSDGIVCAGTYAYGGLFGSATAKLECEDELTVRVIYYEQHGPTSTGIARGIDSKNRFVKAWTGANVLEFLGDGDVNAAKLPCTEDVIPIS